MKSWLTVKPRKLGDCRQSELDETTDIDSEHDWLGQSPRRVAAECAGNAGMELRAVVNRLMMMEMSNNLSVMLAFSQFYVLALDNITRLQSQYP